MVERIKDAPLWGTGRERGVLGTRATEDAEARRPSAASLPAALGEELLTLEL
jgi:hypothetical protein